MKRNTNTKPLDNAKPCPFCGCKIVHEEKSFHEVRRRGIHYIICSTCKSKGGYGGDLNEALQKWNLRVMSV